MTVVLDPLFLSSRRFKGLRNIVVFLRNVDIAPTPRIRRIVGVHVVLQFRRSGATVKPGISCSANPGEDNFIRNGFQVISQTQPGTNVDKETAPV